MQVEEGEEVDSFGCFKSEIFGLGLSWQMCPNWGNEYVQGRQVLWFWLLIVIEIVRNSEANFIYLNEMNL